MALKFVGSEPTTAPRQEPHGWSKASTPARKDRKLPDGSYRVLTTIEHFCWGDSRECWASNSTIGKESGGVSAETVRRHLRKLEDLGYIKVVEDKDKRRGQRIVLQYVLKQAASPLDEYFD